MRLTGSPLAEAELFGAPGTGGFALDAGRPSGIGAVMANSKLIFSVHHGSSSLRQETLEHDVIKIGRDARCHLRLDDELVARLHGVIEVGESEITLVDLGNGIGTRVNDAVVTKTRLHEGDRITLGETTVRLDRIEKICATTPASDAISSNPFAAAAPAFSPFSLSMRAPVTPSAPRRAAVDSSSGAYSYQIVKSGPAVAPHEVERSGHTALEVTVRWRSDVLHVAHLSPPRAFVVGEPGRDAKSEGVDFFIPEERLPARRVSVVEMDGAEAFVVASSGARGFFETRDGVRADLEIASAAGAPASTLAGARRIALTSGSRSRVEWGEFSVEVALVTAGKRVAKGPMEGWDRAVPTYFGLSLATFAGLFSSLAYFVPPLGLVDESEVGKDRLLLIQQYLTASAEREQKEVTPDVTEDKASSEGGTGQQAAGESGAMGKTTATATNKRYAVRGDANNPDPHLARMHALSEARNFGMIGLLNAGPQGDPNAPTAFFGRDTSSGLDDISARGNMWGDEIGDAIGAGGLGLSGIGEGGGSRGEGIGLGPNGIFGHGAGTGLNQGFGPGSGRGLSKGTHKTRVPTIRVPNTTVSGRLPPQVIQRIVRQNFGRFRMCYEQGLSRNPNLEGRVAVRFVVGRDGAVSNVGNGGSDLPDSQVTSCIMSAFYGLSFPTPEEGIVTVTYPLMFSPE